MGNTALIVTKDSRNNGFNFKRNITKIKQAVNVCFF